MKIYDKRCIYLHTGPSASCQGLFNGRCIREESKCNDEDNCGDNSDEEECSGIVVIIYLCFYIQANMD